MEPPNIFGFLFSQVPGFLVGAGLILLPKFVDEWFAKRKEQRAEKQKIIDELNTLFVQAEEDRWKKFPPSEEKFNSLCRRLAQFNFELAESLRFDYLLYWLELAGSGPYSKSTKEEKEAIDECYEHLHSQNKAFYEYAFPEKKFARKYKYKKMYIRFWLKYKILKKIKSFFK
jgi:hypothetical protein